MQYKNIFLIIIFVITFWSCSNSNKPKKGSNILVQQIKLDSIEDYEVIIENNKCAKNKKDVAVLLFEDGFRNDSVNIFRNGKKLFSGKITTDRALGLAKDVELGKFSTINELSIKINNSQEVQILNKHCCFILVNLMDNNKIYIKYDNQFVPYN